MIEIILVFFSTATLYYLYQSMSTIEKNYNHIVTYPTSNRFWHSVPYIASWRSILEHSSLEMRAEPNFRLKKNFGIENTFTTTDKVYYRTFLNKTKKTLGEITPDKWKKIATGSCEHIVKIKRSENTSKSILLSSFVRVLTFRMVMFMFFPEISISSDVLVAIFTNKFNQQWIRSKSLEVTGVWPLEYEKKQLLKLLSKIMGTTIQEGPENPLNLIIPAYETLWRVVLRCFLEIRYCSTGYQLENFRKIAVEFLEKPCINSLSGTSPKSLSMMCVVNEGLRLYPPTRRIHRKFQDHLIGIDVEGIQRDPKRWGPKANYFDPSRWMRDESSSSPDFLPFGIKFQCPAKQVVGPMLIAILTAALITEIGVEYELSETLDSYPLSGARDAFESLKLNKK